VTHYSGVFDVRLHRPRRGVHHPESVVLYDCWFIMRTARGTLLTNNDRLARRASRGSTSLSEADAQALLDVGAITPDEHARWERARKTRAAEERRRDAEWKIKCLEDDSCVVLPAAVRKRILDGAAKTEDQ
jgi:hypothetical protein